MDNIKWITFQSLRGRKTTLEDFDFQVYRKPNAKTEGAGNYLAFSEFLSELYCDKKFLKIGTIEEKIVLSFNDVEGLPVRKNGSGSKRLRVSCKPLIDVIFQKYPYDKDIATNLFSLIELGNNTFLIESKGRNISIDSLRIKKEVLRNQNGM
jgi:hypothetical protein